MRFLIWISIFFFIECKAQTAPELLQYADYSYKNNNYNASVKNYLRLLFFDKEKYGKQCYSKIANSYYKLKDYDQAINYFDLAYNTSDVDSEKQEATFCKALCFMMQKNYDYALMEIYALPDSTNKANQFRKKLYEGSIFFMKEDYEKAKIILQNMYPESEVYKKNFGELYQLFLHENKFSVRRAKIMSYFLPGLGQAYAGDVKNSINSFLLTAGFVTLYLTVATTVSPIEALIGIGPWFQRYYQGGVLHAGIIAQKKKERIKNKFYTAIVECINNGH